MKLQGKWLWRGALTLLALALAWLWLRPTPVTTLTLAAQSVQRSVVATGRVEAVRESARAAPDAPRPARDDYHAVAAIVARSEFADPPGNPSPRERPRGRDRADER